MKQCRQISDLFSEVHENQVDDETGASFSEHIRDCEHCREDFKWYGYTVQALSNLEQVSPPADFVVQLRAKLDRLDSPTFMDHVRNFFSSGPLLPVPVGVAALAVLTVAGVLLYNQSGLNYLPFLGYEVLAQQPRPAATEAPGIPANKQGMAMTKTPPIPGGLLAKSSDPAVSPPAVNSPRYSMLTLNSPPSERTMPVALLPTMADVIGADNLTVESSSVDNAVESVKKALPNLSGRLVEVKPVDAAREVVMGVMIPSQAYGDLASTLINHGAVQAGAGSGVTPPKIAGEDGKQVMLYIRFLKPH